MTSRTRRRTTVHDLASLRLHPDGSRVQPSQTLGSDGIPGVSSQTNLRTSKYIAQDARGNWIARDAGGADFVKRKFGKLDKGKGRASDLDFGGEDGDEVGTDGEDAKDSRAVKRRKFLHDYSFLSTSGVEDDILSDFPGEPSSSTLDPSQSNVPHSLPVPSSDLLKCVHYFASEYYAVHGQLSDLAKEARKEAKLSKSQRSESVLDERDDEIEEQVSTMPEGGVEEDDEHPEEDTTEGLKPKRRGGRKAGKKWAEARIRRDMYKAFDGSALMAIGMLLQEHVAEVMNASPPEGWEEQMEEEEAQENQERRVIGGRRRRRKKRKEDRARAGEEDHDNENNGLAEEQRNSEESSDSEGSSSSSSEMSSSESNDSSDSKSSD